MKNNSIRFIVMIFFIAIYSQINAQHLLSANGKAIVNENQDTIILRGMGLGGWMVQEGYMLQTAGFASAQHQIRATIESLIGPTNTETFYDAWLANHVRKSDIDSLKAWGFNSVRLPMHYNLFTLPIEEEPIQGENTWLSKGFELTDSLISWCKQNEMYVILDLHAAPGGQGYDMAISDYDPNKPSLWESVDNQNKMVALWKRIAERYADEQWVAGYDLLNETNWDLPGGIALRNLYEKATDSIRSVDTEHIIFIEGNWFANDFTGLTPPWDDNIVYSPHKYWSFNDESTMQWVIDLRNQYDVPLYLGESGENSNVWFRDAIRLLEDLDIGWAWWPMKKVESISGPLSIIKTPEYQSLLDYWSGNGSTPSVSFATTTLMDLTEKLKTENCVYQKDVIDAMFRQVYSDETMPFKTHNIPGIIHASDFDMGVVGHAYHDNDVANYNVSTGDFTTWNTGWSYRNDGVDIESCQDNINANGFNVGWVEADEWMQYEVEINASGVYDVHVRVAAGGSGGRFHLEAGTAAVSPSIFTGTTGGWQTWQTSIIPNVILDANDTKLRLYADQSGFNISSLEFIESNVDITSINTEFVAAITIDEYAIKMNANKFLANSSTLSTNDFEIFVDGNSIPITNINLNSNNTRIIEFDVDYLLKSTDIIKISYTGNQILATDGTTLETFTLEDVKNTLAFVHQIPSKIEAEDFDFQSGIGLETTTDIGGGENIGYLDAGDYLDYEVNVTSADLYTVNFRTAAQFGNGQLELQLIDANGISTILGSPNFVSTGGWQTWQTTTEMIQFPEGRYTLRLLITQAPFNLNWIDFSLPTSVTKLSTDDLSNVNIFPNPGNGIFNVQAELKANQEVTLEVYNANGSIVNSKTLANAIRIKEQISLAHLPKGFYFLKIRLADGTFYSNKLIKVD